MTTPHPPPRRQAGVGFILAVILLDMLGVGLIIPVLPKLVEQFMGGDMSAAAGVVGVISACYAVAQFFCAPILGALSDRFGRRRVLLLSMFGLGVDYLVMGFAPSVGWLFLGRLVAGVMGASITTANAYIADISTPETRARNYGLINVAFGIGFILGPVLGGLLGSIDLRLPFFVAAGLCLVNSLYGFFVLPESLAVENRSAFSLRSANPASSILHLRTYPLVASLAVAFMLMMLAQRGLETSWVLYTSYRYGWDELQNGLALAAVGISAALVQGLLVRRAVMWLGERRAVLVGFGIGTLAFAGYGLAPNGRVLITVIVLGSLGGVAGPAVQAIIAGTVAPNEQGKVQGALTSLMSLAAIFAPLLFTAGLFSYFVSAAAPFPLPGAPLLAGSALMAVAMLLLVRTFRRH
jgi:DHA1 family tetracycline resistance protein-like MFS transporter